LQIAIGLLYRCVARSEAASDLDILRRINALRAFVCQRVKVLESIWLGQLDVINVHLVNIMRWLSTIMVSVCTMGEVFESI
jgi:hypothetical protein